MTETGHLITAYGQFWARDEVHWAPTAGGRKQLLGYRGTNRPGIRLCDFRLAAGVYILWNDYRAVYVGLARGADGLFQRLAMHNVKKKEWNRFSWFSVDPVVESDDYDYWCDIEYRAEGSPTPGVSELVRELEALLIMALGTHSLAAQRRMNFLDGTEWLQVTDQSYAPGGVCSKVDPGPLDRRLLEGWK